MKTILREVILVVIWALCMIIRFGMIGNSWDGVLNDSKDTIKLEACVSEEVDSRDDGNRYVVDPDNISGKVLVFGKKYPLYQYGDCLEITGKLSDPESKGDFNYSQYLARYGVYKVMYPDSIKFMNKNNGNWFFKSIYKLKQLFEGRLDLIFTEPYKSFMAGILIGSRRGLPDHLTQDFKTVGLSHVMAISGYNITIVIVVISGLFWFLRKDIRIIVSSIFIVIFVIFVGMSASAVRAAIMGIIGLFAIRFGRQYIAFRGLVVTTIMMSVWNPLILFHDVGFQLSALATLGLIYIYPWINKRVGFLPDFLGIRETFGASISAQIAVLPVLFWNFKQVSLVGIFANLFVLPLIPLAMMTGFLAVIGSFVWAYFGQGMGFIAFLILKIIILIVETFAKVPFASLHF